VEVRVLGPVEVRRADRPLYLARRQQRLLLGILAIEANKLMPIDRLIDLLWGDQPPRHARPVLQSRLSELRTALHAYQSEDQVQVMTRGSAYVLEIDPELVDAHRFRRMVTASRLMKSAEQARRSFRDALALWRGPVLGGHVTELARTALCDSLEAERLTAAEDLFDLELRLSNHQRVADEIREFSSEHPSRERLVGQMMLALHRAGRTADALRNYDAWRRWLAEELGIDPSNDVQELYLAILQADPTLLAGDELAGAPEETTAAALTPQPAEDVAVGRAAFEVAVPRILPPDIPDFTGRASEIEALCDVLTAEPRERCAIAAVSGPGGAGKTALSVHVAHSLQAHFSGGQLYANLRGVDDERPIEPLEVVGRFLRALGVDGSALAESLDERVDLYRNLLSERRVLVLLDNAVSDKQVLPLIPSGRWCAVIVNGRTRLGAAFGATTISLNVLDSDEATGLLSRIAGSRRVSAETDAAQDLCRRCGHLPLAIRVAGAKLAAKPHWPVAKVAHMLADERRRLDHLMLGHLDVRASITLSYTHLDLEVQQLLCRLGDLRMPEIAVWLAAALMDIDLDKAEELLEALFDAQLLDVSGQDLIGYPRYQMHDLVQLFAAERAAAEHSAADLQAARRRAFGAWLFVAESAHRAIYGGDYHHIRGPAARWEFDRQLVQRLVKNSQRWFEVDRPGIVATVRRAEADADHVVCWELVNLTSILFETGRYFEEWQSVLETAHAVARHAGDRRGEAAMQFWIGCSLGDRTEYGQATAYFSSAADLFEQAGDRHGYATATAYRGMMGRFQARYDEALLLYQRALPILREVGDRSGEAWTLRNIGQVYMQQCEYELANAHLEQALTICREIESKQAAAQTLFWVGMLRVRQERYQEAEAEFYQAQGICRAIEDRAGEAQCLRGLGVCAQRRGDCNEAMANFHAALQIVRQPEPTFMEKQIRQSISELRNVLS
jgi:DNA-binding SARP family transcriptional activator